jgi:hypothetical protein
MKNRFQRRLIGLLMATLLAAVGMAQHLTAPRALLKGRAQTKSIVGATLEPLARMSGTDLFG